MRNWLLSSAMAACLMLPIHAAEAANPQLRAIEDGIDLGKDAEENESLTITDMAINMRVHGLSAEVTVTATLANGSDDDIEARFALALPDDAVLTGYALDINGTLIEGVLLEQPKAKKVFEDEVRRGIDPGLAEVSAGNRFETRVYPVPERGVRLIKVRFVVPIGADGTFAWPLETDAPVGRFALRLDASGLAEAPVLIDTFDKRATLTGKNGEWTGQITAANQELDGTITLSGLKQRGEFVLAKHDGGGTFFDLSDGVKTPIKQAAKPARVRVYWDSSRSRTDSLLDEESALLTQYLNWATPETVDVVRLSSGMAQVDSLTGPNMGKAAAEMLKGQVYRGATSFGGLDTLKLPDADVCLVFTDGVTTLDLTAEFDPDCDVIIIASGPNAGGPGAQILADDAGGRLMRLNEDNGADVLANLTKPHVGVVSVTDKNGRRLDHITLPAPSGQWRIIGKAPMGDEIHVRLSGVPRRDAELVYTPDSGARGGSNAAGALWAQRRVTQLSRDPADHDAMVEMAKSYRVASPSMAFLVLESPEQYVRADIVPPVGYDAEWMEDYADIKADSDEDKRLAKAERFDWVLDNWQEVVEHWEEDYDIDAVMKRRGRKRTGATDASASEPPPPPEIYAPASPAAVPSRNVVRTTDNDYSEEAEAAASEATDASADASYDEMPGEPDYQEVIVTGTRRDDSPTEALAISPITDASGATIEVADLLADRPYLNVLKAAKPADRMRVLAEQEAKYGSLPGFYFDTAEYFRELGDRDTARILLLSALDLPSADEETMTIAAFRLQQAGEHDLAVALFERIAANAEFRPQPKRALALALIARAKANPNPRARRQDLERAFVLLTEVALDPFSGDYDGIDVTALMEANAIIPLIEESGGTWSLDKRLVRLLDTDVRIVIEWTNGDSDLDLWVIEPTGEKAYYSNQETDIGGKMSDDMTRGFGPEQYFLRRAADGDYAVIIDGFASDRIRPNGPGRVMVRLIRDFGRPTQSEELVDVEINFDRNAKENERAVAKLKVAKREK
jgi:Vault protein inter-alpha-trypsin domain